MLSTIRPFSGAAGFPFLALAAAVLLAVSSCGGETTPSGGEPAAEDSASAPVSSEPLIDSTIAPAVAGQGGWDYHQDTDVDLDGDGRAERVVLTARVEMRRGRPAWDDGQPWQVYVEGPDTTRTYVYSRRLQLGTLSMRISRGDGGERPSIVLVEHLPDRLRLLEATYEGPDRGVSVATRFDRALDPRGDLASPQLP